MATALVFIVVLLGVVIYYKGKVNEEIVKNAKEVAKETAKNMFEQTNTNTNNSSSIHPFNHCVQIAIQHSKDTSKVISFKDASLYCQALLVDRKEYKEHKNYNTDKPAVSPGHH